MSIRRHVLVLIASMLLGLALLVGTAGAGGANNVVLVQTSTDGATLVRATTEVVPVGGDTVTSANIATSTNAGCVGCHTTAVAVQILIITGNPSSFGPQNAAVAQNGGCDTCGAYAYARQHWIQTSGPAHLDGSTRLRVAQLRQEISYAAASILPSDGSDPCLTPDRKPPYPCPIRDQLLDVKLNALTAELINVVTSGLQESGDTATVLQDNVDVTEGMPAS
jgi:hypothetical protein